MMMMMKAVSALLLLGYLCQSGHAFAPSPIHSRRIHSSSSVHVPTALHSDVAAPSSSLLESSSSSDNDDDVDDDVDDDGLLLLSMTTTTEEVSSSSSSVLLMPRRRGIRGFFYNRFAGFVSGLVGFVTQGIAVTDEYELAELPPPYIPAIFGVVLLAGVGILTSSLGDVMDEEASLGLQSGARAKKEIERSRSSYFKQKR